MTSEHDTKFPLLVEGKYRVWAMKMEAELVRKGLWGVVEVEVEPKEGEDGAEALAKELKKRKKADMAKARAEIVLRVGDDQLELLEDETDPRKCWRVLQDAHRSRGFATELAKWRQFYRAEMEGSETAQAWISRVKGYARALRDVDVEVSDQQKVLVLIMGLGEDFERVVTVVDEMPTRERTFDNVCAKLLNEETRLGKRRDNGEATVANVAASGGASGGKVTCFRCGKVGHIRRNCPDKRTHASLAVVEDVFAF